MAIGKLLVIINPKSGTRSRAGLEGVVRDILGPKADIVYTERSGHATELARKGASDGYRRIVAIGGDGTVNVTACGLVDTGVPMAIVPFGSGNGLARHLHISMKREAALRLAASGKEVDIDSGIVGERRFFCTMGVGFDAQVSHEFANASRRGMLTYSRIAFGNFLHYSPEEYRIEIDGSVFDFKAFLVAVCNASQYGNNAFIAPHASMADGLLDVTVVEGGNLGSLATAGVRLFTQKLDRSHIVHILRGSHIVITRQGAGPGHIDGEAVDFPAVLDIACRPKSLRVVVPEELQVPRN